MKRAISYIVGIIVLIAFYAVGISGKIEDDNKRVSSAWVELLEQYQHRSDLLASLPQQEGVLHEVAAANDKALSLPMSAEQLNNPALFEQATQAQKQLGVSVGRMLSTVDSSSDVKADAPLQEKLTQLKAAEESVDKAQITYIRLVRDYNLMVSHFPGSMLAGRKGFGVMPDLPVDEPLKRPKFE